MKSITIETFPDYKPFVYIEPFPEAITLINKAISDFGSQSELAKKFDCTQSLVSYWKRGLGYIPLNIIDFLCSRYNKNLISFIEGKKLRGGCGGGSLIFHKKLISELIGVDGFIRGDGHIKPNPSDPIVIYQKDRKTLKYIRDLLLDLGVDKNSIGLARAKYENSGLKYLQNRIFYLYHLTICSIPLKFIFVELLQNPVGRKPYNLGLPRLVFESDRELALAEIGGVLSSEGNFHYSNRNPAIRLTTKSMLPSEIEKLLILLGYKPYQINDKRDGFVSIKISGHRQCLSLCFELLPHMISHKKFNDMIKMLSHPHYLNALRFNPNGFFKNAWDIYKTQKNLRIAVYKKFGLKIPRRTLQHWIYNRRTPPLNMVLNFCVLLNKKPTKVLPKDFSLLLYLHNLTDLSTVKGFRDNLGWLNEYRRCNKAARERAQLWECKN